MDRCTIKPAISKGEAGMHILKEQMIAELQLRGYSPKTQKMYLDYMKKYNHHFGKSPDQMGEREIKEYLHYLIIQNKSQSYINGSYSALKFFYENVLQQPWDVNHIPRIKKEKRLPAILDISEVQRLFEVVSNFKHRTILMTVYAAGLRVSEVVNLKVTDIDSKRMQIRVEQGKGKKDRYTLLSEVNLEMLRLYWQMYRPKTWLFPSYNHDIHISIHAVQKVFERAKQKAGIQKKVSVHSLRHSFATHLLESGADIFYIQQLLGHASVKTTTVYIHLRNQNALKITSPLDQLYGKPKHG
jgi:site-specific recombinase XerD